MMKRVMIVDTETTGKLEDDPYIVQVAAQTVIYSDDAPPFTAQENMFVVKCPIPIPPGATAVHGITDAMSAHGVTQLAVLKWILNQSGQVDLLVCHNTAYDSPVIDQNLLRCDLGRARWPEIFCTMMGAKDLCKISGFYQDYKWPSLKESLEILCFHELKDAHDALGDVRGARVLLDYMVDLGLCPALKGLEGPGVWYHDVEVPAEAPAEEEAPFLVP